MTDAGIVIDVKTVPLKASVSILVIILFRLIDFILLARYRALAPILVTVDGMVYVVAVLPIGYVFKTVWFLLNRTLLIDI